MDLAEFDDLIDMYRHYQMHGNLNERSDSRRALKDAFRALEAERDALRMTEETAMRAAIRVMSNLEDRRGVLDGVDEDVKQEIADEIAFTIFAAIAAKGAQS